MTAPVTLLENTHDWPKGVQGEVDSIASLDGDDSSISGDDMFIALGMFCSPSLLSILTWKIINWKTDALWRGSSRLESPKGEFSATNKVYWHLDKEAALAGEDKKRQAYEILKEIKQRYLERLAETPNISDQDKLKLVYQVLLEMGFIFGRQGSTSFIDNLVSKQLDCDTSSFIVRALAEEFGWPVHLIAVPEHVFVRYGDGKEAFNIDFGIILPNDYYVKKYNVEGDLLRYEAIVYGNLGLALKAKGDVDGAIEAYNKALEIYPRYADAWSNLSTAKLKTGDVDGAIEACKYALETYPRYAKIWFNLGVAKFKKGDPTGAIDAFEKALLIDPKFTDARHNLGAAKLKTDDVDGAIKTYKQLLKIDPRYAKAWYGLGLAKRDKGDLDGAEKAFQKARELAPSLFK